MISATSVKDALRSSAPRDSILVQGWVRTRRDSKTFSFIEVNDGSSLKNLQIIARDTLPNYPEVQKLTAGASITARGKLVASQGKGQSWEVVADELTIVGASDDTYPLQKKGHTPEFLREIAHLRPRSNLFGSVFRVRSRLAFAIHQFFQERGFVYVHTPIITGSDCEGAGELFRITTIDPKDPPRTGDGAVDYARDFFARSTFLTVSGQLEAEAFACALSKVYTFGPTFRAENSNTSRHANEFWMIEPEMAFCDLNGNMDVAEELVKYLIAMCGNTARTNWNCSQSSSTRSCWRGSILCWNGRSNESVTRRPSSCCRRAAKNLSSPSSTASNLQSEHERWLAERHFKCPVTVFNFPKEIKPFYMRLNDDDKTVTAMDVLVPGIGEIVGGSQREERLRVSGGKHAPAQSRSGRLQVVSGLAPLRNCSACRVRSRLRADADVRDRRLEHSRRDSLRAHTRERGVLIGARRKIRLRKRASPGVVAQASCLWGERASSPVFADEAATEFRPRSTSCGRDALQNTGKMPVLRQDACYGPGNPYFLPCPGR